VDERYTLSWRFVFTEADRLFLGQEKYREIRARLYTATAKKTLNLGCARPIADDAQQTYASACPFEKLGDCRHRPPQGRGERRGGGEGEVGEILFPFTAFCFSVFLFFLLLTTQICSMSFHIVKVKENKTLWRGMSFHQLHPLHHRNPGDRPAHVVVPDARRSRSARSRSRFHSSHSTAAHCRAAVTRSRGDSAVLA